MGTKSLAAYQRLNRVRTAQGLVHAAASSVLSRQLVLAPAHTQDKHLEAKAAASVAIPAAAALAITHAVGFVG